MRIKQQRGGTILGFVIGVVVGLGAALAVAVYVTKVPIPFVNKGQTRNAEQDAAEASKNKDWQPNKPLWGKNPVQPVAPAVLEEAAPATAPAATAPPVTTPPVTAAPAAKAPLKPAVSADPLGDFAKANASVAGDPFHYFVQAGAFRIPEEAESQRAKLSLSGQEAKVTEREQAGRTVYRVRVGPFDKKEDADKTKARLEAAGLEAALVRVQR